MITIVIIIVNQDTIHTTQAFTPLKNDATISFRAAGRATGREKPQPQVRHWRAA
jgi:hypothetical protein